MTPSEILFTRHWSLARFFAITTAALTPAVGPFISPGRMLWPTLCLFQKGLRWTRPPGSTRPSSCRKWSSSASPSSSSRQRGFQALEARIAELEARVQQRAHTSDRPPSSDPPYEKRPTRAGPHGKPGAKPGHPGHQPALLAPPEVIEVKPSACACGQTACLDTRASSTHQVIELPEIPMLVRHCVW